LNSLFLRFQMQEADNLVYFLEHAGHVNRGIKARINGAGFW